MLKLDASTRVGLWRELVAAIETATEADELPVLTERDANEVRAFVERFDFDAPLEPVEALRLAVYGLSRYAVNFRSPRYFGLLDPAPAAMGVVAEALAAAFNPQLAAWLASPFAIETEGHLIRAVGTRFGLPADGVEGRSRPAEPRPTTPRCSRRSRARFRRSAAIMNFRTGPEDRCTLSTTPAAPCRRLPGSYAPRVTWPETEVDLIAVQERLARETPEGASISPRGRPQGSASAWRSCLRLPP